ncbi:hypothetical protein C7399_11289 [Paraburkholderia tropica]|uniref:Uncharacterized protein n=1 Tax=Paraburkholderia tropica TaxID=92647 RepID=A0ABX5MMP6_9BURK|nr:hypothetical protein C7400_11289 [Paraburkholderia tropica]PZW79545.1 hypothetical protein C7399_11289 [Paraburkholderia tropica]
MPAIAKRGSECGVNTFEWPAIVTQHFRLPQRAMGRRVIAVWKRDVGLVQSRIIDFQLNGRSHYTAVEDLSAPSHRCTSCPMPFGLRVGTNEYVNGRLSCDFRYEVRPAHCEGAVSYRHHGSVQTQPANVVAFYLESHAVHVRSNLCQLDMDFEAAVVDQAIHGCATMATSLDVSPSPQSDDIPNCVPATGESGTERVVGAVKRTARATRFCFGSRRNSGVFAVCDGLDNVELRLTCGRKPAFDRHAHLPAVECVKARFHKPSHRVPGRPSRDRKCDSQTHSAPNTTRPQAIYGNVIDEVSTCQ